MDRHRRRLDGLVNAMIEIKTKVNLSGPDAAVRDPIVFPKGALKFGPAVVPNKTVLYCAWLEVDGKRTYEVAWLGYDGHIRFPSHGGPLDRSPTGTPMLFARAVVNEFEKVWSRHEQAKLPNWIVAGERFHTREEAWFAAWHWFVPEENRTTPELEEPPKMPDDINEANRLLRDHHGLQGGDSRWVKIEKFGDDPLLCTLDGESS